MANELEKQTEELKRQTQFASEMTDQIKGMSTALVASQATIARTYQKGLSDVSNQIDQGLSDVSRELGRMSASFSFGLNRVSDGLNFMSDAMCKRLDALHNIVNNPLLTQAQELYRLALGNYNKGFFEEALDNVKQAIEKYKTDYMSWFLMGHIYTFGEGEFSNVINLEQAFNAFTQAAKYNSPNITSSQDARLLASEIYFYWGTSQYLQYKELLKAGKKEEMSKMLDSALKSFEKSFQYSEKMLEAFYNSIRCKARQNNVNAAITDLEKLFLLDRNYCISVCKDTDLADIRDEIEDLIIRMRHKVFIEAEPKYKKIIDLIAECKNLNIDSYKVPVKFSEELPYFDVLDYNVEFGRMIPQIETSIHETIERNRRIEQERIECELREKQERKDKEEQKLKEAEQKLRDAEQKKQYEKWKRRWIIWRIAAPLLAVFSIIMLLVVDSAYELSIGFGEIVIIVILLIPFTVVYLCEGIIKRVVLLIVGIGLSILFIVTTINSGTPFAATVPFIIGYPVSLVLAMINGRY